nr:NAC domain-containing protein 62-like [Ipomoea batatas]
MGLWLPFLYHCSDQRSVQIYHFQSRQSIKTCDLAILPLERSTTVLLPLSSLPLGFRFHPTNEELINHYLKLKINGLKAEVSVIRKIDICKLELWDLPGESYAWLKMLWRKLEMQVKAMLTLRNQCVKPLTLLGEERRLETRPNGILPHCEIFQKCNYNQTQVGNSQIKGVNRRRKRDIDIKVLERENVEKFYMHNE